MYIDSLKLRTLTEESHSGRNNGKREGFCFFSSTSSFAITFFFIDSEGSRCLSEICVNRRETLHILRQ